MSDNSQPVQTPEQDDQNKNIQPKYTVKLFGRFVPIWLVVVVVAVLAWLGWNMWTQHKKSVQRLTSSTRADLDKVVVTTTTSPSPALPVTMDSASGAALSTPSTETTRKQLNNLFNSF